MALAAVVAGNRIVVSDLNAYYNLLKGVTGSGESITLIHAAAASLIFQPSSDPAAGTEVVQIKNNAGTVQSSLTYDGKVKVADGTAALPSLRFQSEATGLRLVSAGVIGASVAAADSNFRIGASYISVGATPATTGSIRLSNASSIYTRNAANSADIRIIDNNASETVNIGTATGGAIVVGALVVSGATLTVGTTPATAGVIRIPNNLWLTARNQANGANVPLIGLDPSDQISLGGGSTNTVTMGAAAGGKFVAQGTLTAGGLLATAVQICTSGPLIYSGSGVPTISAAVKGSLYLRSDGTSGTTRAYIATDTAGTWTALNTVA